MSPGVLEKQACHVQLNCPQEWLFLRGQRSLGAVGWAPRQPTEVAAWCNPLLPQDAAAFTPSDFPEAICAGFLLQLWMTRGVSGFPFIC